MPDFYHTLFLFKDNRKCSLVFVVDVAAFPTLSFTCTHTLPFLD